MKLIYKFVIVSFILAIAHQSFAQDKVHLQDGNIYDGKVTAIDSTTIILSMGEKDPALLFQISLIKAIVYSDGRVETFENHLRNLNNKLQLHPTPTANFLNTPVLFSLLGGVVPVQGLGQFYNGDRAKGYSFLGLGAIGFATWAYSINDNLSVKYGRKALNKYGIAVYFGSLIISVFDAHQSSKVIARIKISMYPTKIDKVTGVGFAILL